MYTIALFCANFSMPLIYFYHSFAAKVVLYGDKLYPVEELQNFSQRLPTSISRNSGWCKITTGEIQAEQTKNSKER
jgi:hypothetical protein